VERFVLVDAQAAYDKLRHGQISGRAVIMPAA
jgi:D-arabinose 1-dehydrogenase-like Zn-dependent alcohol dehydrogenase